MKIFEKLITIAFLSLLTFQVLAQVPEWKRVNYPSSSIFTGVVTVNGNMASTMDMIAVFVNSECRMLSSVVVVNDTSFVSAVIHVDSIPENAKIKYWNAATNTIYDLDTSFIVNSHGTIKRFPITIKSEEEVPTSTVVPAVVSNDVNIYPAPFNNIITITAQKEIKKVQIYNSIGSIVASDDDIFSNSVTLQTSNCVSGLYLVSIEFSDGVIVTKKVFKK